MIGKSKTSPQQATTYDGKMATTVVHSHTHTHTHTRGKAKRLVMWVSQEAYHQSHQ